MPTPDELRDAAHARITPTDASPTTPQSRRRAVASFAAANTPERGNYPLGASYSTLSVKIPAHTAEALATTAAIRGVTLSTVAREWLDAGAAAQTEPTVTTSSTTIEGEPNP